MKKFEAVALGGLDLNGLADVTWRTIKEGAVKTA